MDSLQISYTNSNTGIQIGVTPECKYIHEKKQTSVTCVFVVNSKEAEPIKKYQPIEICALLCGSKGMSEERIQNFHRGVKKILKNLKNEDTFHLISITDKINVITENEKFDSKEGRKKRQDEIFPKLSTLNMDVTAANFHLGLKKSYELLATHGGDHRLKRILLFFDNPMKFKKNMKTEIQQTIIGMSNNGYSLSAITIGSTFSETDIFDFTHFGKGTYLYCNENVHIPQKVSKFMHGVTDLLLARNGELLLTCKNGMIISKTKLYSQATPKREDTTSLYINDIHKKAIRKILIDLTVTIKDPKSKENFLEFEFKFIPTDSFSGKYEELKGKLRFYVTKNAKDFNVKNEHTYLKMGKQIAHYADVDMQIYKDLLSKKIKKAHEKEKNARKTLNKYLGKDSTGHVDKLVRIFFSQKELLYSSNSSPVHIAKSYYATSKMIDDDNDFGYMSGKDSDYGCWSDNEEEEEEGEKEEEGDDVEEGEDYGEDNEDDIDDDEDDEFDNVDDGDGDDDEFDQEDFGDEFDVLQPIDGVKKEEKAIVVDVIKLVEEQTQKIHDIAEALNLTVGVAGALLKFYKWDNERLYADFFENKEKLCKKANVTLTNVPYLQGPAKKEMECLICYDDVDGKDMFALPCKHFFCRDCWGSFLSVSVSDGPVCLMTPCPFRGCTKICGEELVKKLVEKKKYELYNRYLIRSFVDDNPKIKWCPAPDCGKAVYCPEIAQDNVICSCGQKFCFKCQMEAHEPCTCDKLVKWRQKEKGESETANWLLVHTKLCPGCTKAMEKNGGCNHMTCSQCKHEFCWICLDDWKVHGSKTGGYYKCNKYNPEELKKKTNQSKVDKARAELEKYMHYFKRYANHLNSQKFEEELKKKSEDKMKKLQLKHKYSSWSDVEYIQKGIDQLIECRRTLKYTYIHAYYLTKGGEKNLFEFLQEDLERETERLSGLLEADIAKFDRDQIIASSKSAQTRLKNLLDGVKTGLLEK